MCPPRGRTPVALRRVGSYFTAQPNVPQIDRLPLEATVGWDATLNGNLAELLQEPSLMGAYEGAGITVLGKGLDFHGQDPWNDGSEAGAFPAVTTLLTGCRELIPVRPRALRVRLLVGDANPLCHTVTYNANGTVRSLARPTHSRATSSAIHRASMG